MAFQGLPRWPGGKESDSQAGNTGSISGLERCPNPLLPGKSHGLRGLVGYSPWNHKTVGYNLVDSNNNSGLLTFCLTSSTLNRNWHSRIWYSRVLACHLHGCSVFRIKSPISSLNILSPDYWPVIHCGAGEDS